MLREAPEIRRIIIKTGRTDLRFGIDKLANLVQMKYGLDPLEKGTLFLFCGHKRDRIKGLLYEGDGYLLLMKRLSQGTFQWPKDTAEAREMSREEYVRLMDGYTVEGGPIRTFEGMDRKSGGKPDQTTQNGTRREGV